MKKFPTASLALIVLFALCTSVRGQIFSANLSGINEVPPVASNGTGFALVTLSLATHTLTIHAEFSNLTGTVTNSHIHTPAPPGTNAGIATQTPTFSGFPNGVTSGTYDRTFDTLALTTYNPSFVTANGGTAASAETAFANGLRAELAYFNIHSTFATGGEIRGQLRAVPEFGSTGAFFALALAGLFCFRQRARAIA